MTFCSHNEVDLEPIIVHDKQGADWVAIGCSYCKRIIGKRYRLIDLVEKSIKKSRERSDE